MGVRQFLVFPRLRGSGDVNCGCWPLLGAAGNVANISDDYRGLALLQLLVGDAARRYN